MSRKSRSPADLARFNVDFGTALDRALASAQDPHGRIVPVNVQSWMEAIILTIRVSGCPKILWATLISIVIFCRVAALTGWHYERTTGSHRIYHKAGVRLNLAIPDHVSLGEGILRRLLRTMDLTIEEFLAIARK